MRPGKRTLLMTKKLRVDRTVGYGPAVHRNIGAMLPDAGMVNNLRKHLFSRSALPRNKHRKIGRRHLPRYVNRPLQPSICTNNTKPLLNLL